MVQTALITNANAKTRAFAFGSILPDPKISKETQTFEMATLQRGVENVGKVAEWYYSGILWARQ